MSKLVLCCMTSNSPNMNGMLITMGEMIEESNGVIELKAPLSVDLNYFAMVGKRLRPISSAKEMQESRADQSVRALPQLSPSDFLLMSIKECKDYPNTTMFVHPAELMYTMLIDVESALGVAYHIIINKMVTDNAFSSSYQESIFSLDVAHFTEGMLDPDTMKEVLLPALQPVVAPGQGERG